MIADTQRNSSIVADEVVSDWNAGKIQQKKAGTDISDLLHSRGIRFVTWLDWKLVDRAERELGAKLGKPREKIIDVMGFLAEKDNEKSAARTKD